MGSDFFVPTRTLTVADIARLTGASLRDPAKGEDVVSHLAAASEAGVGALAFVDGKKHANLLVDISATAVICPEALGHLVPVSTAALIHKNPLYAFAKIGREMFPEAAFPVGATSVQGISPHAYIDATADVEVGAIVEAGAVVGRNCSVGAGTVVAANAVLGPNCTVGRNSYVGPNASARYALIGDRVTIHAGAGIGRDGFGFASGERGLEHVPQLGRVIIQDDAEIGANSCVDRGALSDTMIGEGTKIDNLVQIGHNTRIGRHCVIAGHCGIAGSVVIGDQVMIGGGVGIADHVTIGSRAQVAGGSGVMIDIPEGARQAGYPAVPVRQFFRQVAKLSESAKGKKSSDDD